MGLLGDNRGRKEGGTPIAEVAFLKKSTSPKWELSEPIRSGGLNHQRGGVNVNDEGCKT